MRDGGDGLLVDERVHVGEVLAEDALPEPHEVGVGRELGAGAVVNEAAGGNCIKIGLPGKSILRDYFQENRTSKARFIKAQIEIELQSFEVEL